MLNKFENSPAFGAIAHAALFRVRGLSEEAVELLERASKRYPEEAVLFYELGGNYQKLERHTSALSAFDRAIQLEPTFYEAWVNKGTVYYGLNRIPEAASHFKEAIKIDERRFEAYANLGNCYRAEGNFLTAADCYKHAISLGGDSPEVCLCLALAYQGNEDFKEALEQYQVCLDKIVPDKAYKVYVLMRRAYLYQLMKSPALALSDLELADNLLPNRHSILHRKGAMLDLLGHVDEAIKTYERAVEINPKCQAAAAELQLLYSKASLEKIIRQSES
jgi:superkiller protein 3